MAIYIKYVGNGAERLAAKNVAEHFGFPVALSVFRQLKMIRGISAEFQAQAIDNIVMILWLFGVSGYPVKAIICRYAGLAAFNRWQTLNDKRLNERKAQ